MSVITTADEKRDLVKTKLHEIIDLLIDITVEECWGWEEYNRAYQLILIEALTKIIHILKEL